MFVTSTAYFASLGGLAGADIKCNDAVASATARVLGRTFKAWLSSESESASSRLVHGTGAYVLADGTTIVADNWTDLTDGTLTIGIDQDEMGADASGQDVWTGTAADGSMIRYHVCRLDQKVHAKPRHHRPHRRHRRYMDQHGARRLRRATASALRRRVTSGAELVGVAQPQHTEREAAQRLSPES
jgi:hypothetical protein